MFAAIFVVSLIVVIMIHEFGHFATAKAFGMKCSRFFLGFGPTLWSVQRGETEYGVKAIPAGGFVKIVGMSAFEDHAPEDRGRTFFEQAAWKRAIVLSAGSATHLIVAVVLLFAALALVGLPTGEATNEVALVTEDGPAARAGIEEGDRILEVAGVAITDFEAVREAVVARPGQTVPVVVERDGRRHELEVTLAAKTPEGERQGFLGVGPRAEIRPLPPSEAFASTFTGDFSVVRLTTLTVQGLGQAFSPEGLTRWLGSVTGEGPRTADGPISVVGATQVAGELGSQGDLFGFLIIIAQLNIVLGLLNMLPLPPLDGGHLAVLVAEEGVNGVRRLRGKRDRWRIDPARLTPIALAVILFFGLIFVTAVYIDIVRPASEILQ